MRASTLLPISLEPLSRKNPGLLVDNDLKLTVLETLEKEGPLNIEDLKNKTRLDVKTLKRIIASLEKEGSITKPKTRYNLTEIGKGIVEGFIKPSPDEKLDVLSIVASHPNASTVELLQLRNPEPGYKEVVELYSALDELREKGLVKRNNGGWEVGGSFIEKIFPVLNDPGAQTNGTPTKERTEKSPVQINKPKKEDRRSRTKEVEPKKGLIINSVPAEILPEKEVTITLPVNNPTETEEAIVIDPTPPSLDTSPEEIVILEEQTPPQIKTLPKEEVIVSGPPSPAPKPISEAHTVSPLSNGRKTETPTEKTLQKDPNLGIRISQAIRSSDLENKKVEAISLLKAAVVKLQSQGEQITENSLTDKANHSEELVETLHIFFVLKHDRIRDFLRFASKNAKAFKNAPTAKLD